MISIIACISDINLFTALTINISETIGCEHEIVSINNVENRYSIFQAYNLGIELAKYDILCFCHEDLIFHTKNWGQKVINHLNNSDVGLIGVAGNTIHPNLPAGWWNATPFNLSFVNIIQQYRESGQVLFRKTLYRNPRNLAKEPVVTLDGLWFCGKRSIFDSCSFDDEKFNGFHCYDTDISLQVSQFKTNYVVFDILIEHFSLGSKSIQWVDAVNLLTDKWSKQLPYYVGSYTSNQKLKFTTRCLLSYCFSLRQIGYNTSFIRGVIASYLKPKSFILMPLDSLFLSFWFLFGNKATRNLHTRYVRIRSKFKTNDE